jgi:hypothetical protein
MRKDTIDVNIFWYLPFPIKLIKMDFNILSSLIPLNMWIIDKFKHFYLVFLNLNRCNFISTVFLNLHGTKKYFELTKNPSIYIF